MQKEKKTKYKAIVKDVSVIGLQNLLAFMMAKRENS